MVSALNQSDGTMDYSIYPKFRCGMPAARRARWDLTPLRRSSLIASRRVEPKKRPLSWLMRLIEEIYDARFAHDTADLRDEPEGGDEGGQGVRLSNLFPVFVVRARGSRMGPPPSVPDPRMCAAAG